MSQSPVLVGLAALGTTALGGCMPLAVDSAEIFAEVARSVEVRTEREIVRESQPGPDIPEVVRALLADGLTGDDAIRIALLNNRSLQALYTDLDVSQSDLLQASLLHNPIGDVSATLPVGGGIVDLSFGLALDVVDLIYVPMRKRIAAAELEETKLRVTAEVLDFVGRAQTGFYHLQAAEQMLEMRKRVTESIALAAEMAKRMRAAGNITALELAAEQALEHEARLDLRMAEITVGEQREEMNRVMGLYGEAAAWELASRRLPDPPEEDPETEGLERRALEKSLDLAIAERRTVAAGAQLGLTRASALFPEILVGALSDRDGGEWEAGPSFAIPIPFFDRGQARNARAEAELQRAHALYHALAVNIRSATRAARDRTIGHRERALFYRNTLLPLREEVVRQTMLQFNAMQLTPFDVLRAKEQQIEAGAHYVEALLEYWQARSELGLILAGRVPAMDDGMTAPAIDSPRRSSIPTLN